ncbi:MAG: V-type ATPase subunit [Candidatus Brocadiaceae bacterium]|nr:V-type ATPase subunit [Candidatus Brocadiaceae bacterium]
MSDMGNSVRHYDWCYVSGRVNVLECCLLSSNFFERLLSTDDFKDVLANMNDTPLKAYFTHAKHLYEFEKLLDEYYYNRLYEMRSLSPDSAVCDFFLIRNDFINLKQFAKSKVLGAGAGAFLWGTVSQDRLDDIWQDRVSILPEIFKESISFFKSIINRISKESIPFVIDMIFDGAYLRYMGSICEGTGINVIKTYVKTFQFIKGLEIMRRAMSLKIDMNLFNQYFIEKFDKGNVFYKLTKNTVWASENTLRKIFVETHCNASLQGLLLSNLSRNISFQYEVATDNYLLDMLRPVKYIPFGPERVFGYLSGLATEVFNLKLLLGGKVHRIENNLLRERLRRTYV